MRRILNTGKPQYRERKWHWHDPNENSDELDNIFKPWDKNTISEDNLSNNTDQRVTSILSTTDDK